MSVYSCTYMYDILALQIYHYFCPFWRIRFSSCKTFIMVLFGQVSKIEFGKIFQASSLSTVICFRKKLYLRCLTAI